MEGCKMKKRIALALAVALVLSLSSCGDSTESAASPSGEESAVSVVETATPAVSEEPVDNLAWGIQQTVDEFGDVTEDSETVLTSEIQGDFSNTATTSSELNVVVRFAKKPISGHYVAQFVLLEYGDTPATYLDSDDLVLKTKVDDSITEYSLSGEAPNGSLFLGLSDYNYDGDLLFNELYAGKDIRCIINIESSQYNFTITSGNFATLSDENDFEATPAEMTISEAVAVFLNDDSKHATEAGECLKTHASDMNLLNSDTFTNSLNGAYLEISTGGYQGANDGEIYPIWYLQECTNTTMQESAEITPEELGSNSGIYYREYQKRTNTALNEITIEGDNFVRIGDFYYQIREVSEDIYLLCRGATKGEFTRFSLLIPCNREVENEDDFDSAFVSMRETLLTNLQ
jgi:hypothetical protein